MYNLRQKLFKRRLSLYRCVVVFHRGQQVLGKIPLSQKLSTQRCMAERKKLLFRDLGLDTPTIAAKAAAFVKGEEE